MSLLESQLTAEAVTVSLPRPRVSVEDGQRPTVGSSNEPTTAHSLQSTEDTISNDVTRTADLVLYKRYKKLENRAIRLGFASVGAAIGIAAGGLLLPASIPLWGQLLWGGSAVSGIVGGLVGMAKSDKYERLSYKALGYDVKPNSTSWLAAAYGIGGGTATGIALGAGFGDGGGE